VWTRFNGWDIMLIYVISNHIAYVNFYLFCAILIFAFLLCECVGLGFLFSLKESDNFFQCRWVTIFFTVGEWQFRVWTWCPIQGIFMLHLICGMTTIFVSTQECTTLHFLWGNQIFQWDQTFSLTYEHPQHFWPHQHIT
jgi:hypothetical protein